MELLRFERLAKRDYLDCDSCGSLTWPCLYIVGNLAKAYKFYTKGTVICFIIVLKHTDNQIIKRKIRMDKWGWDLPRLSSLAATRQGYLDSARREQAIARPQRNRGDSSQSLSPFGLILPTFTNSSSFWVQHVLAKYGNLCCWLLSVWVCWFFSFLRDLCPAFDVI